ncbi:MAG TPA: alcohol dehydrogenase catalytic domain-containing protein [Cryobacterium sp.]|nr:alcohol dehydrogenase catalytic domain-containing protein [Cryobacterium sp.]
MSIRGAVLRTVGAARPYRVSRPLEISDLQLERPGPGEILVKIEAAGLCHSDLSVVNGSRVRPTPMLLGHEAAGRVVELGAEVSDLRIGQRVVMAFLPRCGECAGCRTDGKLPCIPGTAANTAGSLLGGGRRLTQDDEPVHHHLGVSAFASHAVVNRFSVVPVDDDVPADIAAVLGCAVLTGGGAVINAGKPGPADTVAIVGLGGVGMAALITALSLDVAAVIGIDSVPAKLEHALALGAGAVFTPDAALEQGIRADVVIEAAGHPRAFETAVRLTAAGGTTVTVGLPAADQLASVSPTTITAEARTIIGSYLGSAVPSRDIPFYAQLWREGRLPVERLISSHIRLDDINEGMDTLADGNAVRQIILFD